MGSKRTVTSQIEEVERQISEYEENLEDIEKSLRLEELTDQRRRELTEEQKRLKKDIAIQDSALKQLRKENWKNAILSLLFMALIYLAYHSIWAP
ncbi:coiled-coil domain-containing protein 167-like [Mytilus edulis]|uniref:coiled-coil domain-containing protein 167-like n=1 Tax=Mytilus edulis TaxID=6550 RepID=UPI0039F0A936